MNYWDRIAPFYDWFMKSEEKMYREALLEIKPYLKGTETLLEGGAGPGTFTRFLSPLCETLVAMDFSRKMVEQGKKSCKDLSNVMFMQGDVTSMEFLDESFDAVFMANTLHILPEPEKALKEIHRILKKDGLFFAPNFVKTDTLRGKWGAGILAFSGCKVHSPWTLEEYGEFLSLHGFAILSADLIEGKINMGNLITRKKESL